MPAQNAQQLPVDAADFTLDLLLPAHHPFGPMLHNEEEECRQGQEEEATNHEEGGTDQR